ncbi:MAG: guanylate kinase [Alphaproteobacteria bacterium]|nr:guanylate kinase [Alphaproteobacteria bacterium]MCK5659290.1 guanylate kinase [Alphaproteobacteria bacterium]
MTAASNTHFLSPQPKLRRRGVMLVLASPPGGGKTTITRKLMQLDPQTSVSISATTRAKRPGEEEGQHYYFVSPEKFKKMVDDGDMLEYALVYNGNMYGTPKAPVKKILSEGRDILFDIDWQGKRNLEKFAGEDIVSIFLLPPSWNILKERLHGRARDNEEEIKERLDKAQDEISHYAEFQYVIINNNLEDSIRQVQEILEAERLKRHRLLDIQDFVDTLKSL